LTSYEWLTSEILQQTELILDNKIFVRTINFNLDDPQRHLERFSMKEGALLETLANLNKSEVGLSYISLLRTLINSEFAETDFFSLWSKSIFFDVSSFLSKISLMFNSLRYLNKGSKGLEESSQSYSLYRMLATPELSHFVLYRSGLYSTKVLLYLSHPILRSLLKSYDDDWSFNIDFADQFVSLINFFESKLKILNDLKSELFISLFILLYLSNDLNIKGFSKSSFITLSNCLFTVVNKQRELYSLISQFLYDSNEEELAIFSAYNVLKRSFFFYSLGVLEGQRYSEWFQKNISNLLAREYERIWLSLLQKNFVKMLGPNQIVLRTYFIESRVITTRLLFNYFCRHLRQRKPVNTILGMILNELKRQKALIGFKILTSGRFTRRERALYKWQVFQRTPLSLYGSYLDFFAGVYKSRFGVCSFKFWFFKE